MAMSATRDGRKRSRDQNRKHCAGLLDVPNQRTCFRYEQLLSDENAKITDWLIRLTANHKTWVFVFCICVR